MKTIQLQQVRITDFLAKIAQKAKDEPEQYSVINSKAKNISKTSNEFYAFLDGVKTEVEAPYVEDKVRRSFTL